MSSGPNAHDSVSNDPPQDVSNTPDSPNAPDSPSSLGRSSSQTTPMVTGWKRIAFLAGAGFFFVLGVIGAIFPVLPATPFLLLTSYFLLRASPALNKRLLRSKFFGPILMDWQERGGIRQHIKVKAIVVVCMAVATTIYFSMASPVIVTVVCIAALIGIAVIVRLPSV